MSKRVQSLPSLGITYTSCGKQHTIRNSGMGKLSERRLDQPRDGTVATSTPQDLFRHHMLEQLVRMLDFDRWRRRGRHDRRSCEALQPRSARCAVTRIADSPVLFLMYCKLDVGHQQTSHLTLTINNLSLIAGATKNKQTLLGSDI